MRRRPAQTQRQVSGWQAQFGPQAQVAGAAGWAWACSEAWQPQVQAAPGQLTQAQDGVVVACMKNSLRWQLRIG